MIPRKELARVLCPSIYRRLSSAARDHCGAVVARNRREIPEGIKPNFANLRESYLKGKGKGDGGKRQGGAQQGPKGSGSTGPGGGGAQLGQADVADCTRSEGAPPTPSEEAAPLAPQSGVTFSQADVSSQAAKV